MCNDPNYCLAESTIRFIETTLSRAVGYIKHIVSDFIGRTAVLHT